VTRSLVRGPDSLVRGLVLYIDMRIQAHPRGPKRLQCGLHIASVARHGQHGTRRGWITYIKFEYYYTYLNRDTGGVVGTDRSNQQASLSAMSEPRFYSLDLAGIPDEEWNADCDRSRAWPKHCRSTSDKAGFPTNTLSSTAEIEEWPHWERKVGFALYVSLNVIPVSLLPLLLAWLLLPGSLSNTAGCMLLAALGYILALLAG
jgi:hypothetical protein